MLLLVSLLFSMAFAQNGDSLVQTVYYASNSCIPGSEVGYVLTKTPGACTPDLTCTTVTAGFVNTFCPTEFPAPYQITTTRYDSVTTGYCPGLNIQGLAYFLSQTSFKTNTCIPDATFQLIAGWYGLPNYVLGQWPGRQFQCYNDIYSLAYQNFPVMDLTTGVCAGEFNQGQRLYQRAAGTNVPSMYRCDNGVMSTGCGINDCFHENTTITYGDRDLTLKQIQNREEPECEIPHVVDSVGVTITAKCADETKVLKLTRGHLMYTQRGLQKAEDITTDDTLFSDMKESSTCQVLSNTHDKGTAKYFGLNCHNSAVLASGIKSSTFEKIHSVPSFWMSVVGKVLGIKRASQAGDYIAELVQRMNFI